MGPKIIGTGVGRTGTFSKAIYKLSAARDQPVPSEPFPQTNSRVEFWELVKKGSAPS